MTKIRDRDQLVEAAARVFARKGFDSASMEDIAAEVGVLQGSLYYHVSSKAELLFLVQRRHTLRESNGHSDGRLAELPQAIELVFRGFCGRFSGP